MKGTAAASSNNKKLNHSFMGASTNNNNNNNAARLGDSFNLPAHHAATSMNNMYHMKFDAFTKAIALLAYTFDPLPSQPFAERLTKFIPQFCESVRPVVLAMARAKNVEIDRKVNIRASESRTTTATANKNKNDTTTPGSPMMTPMKSSLKNSTTLHNNNDDTSNNNKNDGDNAKNTTSSASTAMRHQPVRPSTTSATAGSRGLKNMLSSRR